MAQRLTSTGAVTSTDLYDGYGSRTGTITGALANTYGGQSGYYTDNEIGLILCTHRFYDPAVGRFLTRDPIGYSGGVNLYGYTQNNPIMGRDPLGFWNIYKWIYTSDGNASDEIYNGALQDFADQVPTRSPDYVSLNLTLPAGSLLRSALGKSALGQRSGGALQIVVDRYGYVYFGGGVAVGSKDWGGTGMAGWLDQGGHTAPSEDDLDDFIEQASWNATAAYGVAIGTTFSPVGEGDCYHVRQSYELGVGNPQIGVNVTSSKRIKKVFHGWK